MRNRVLEDEAYEEESSTKSLEYNTTTKYFQLEKVVREPVNIKMLLKNKIDKNDAFCSFELLPVKKNNDVYQRFFTEMKKYSPLFYALTWHTTNTSKSYPSLESIEMFPNNTLLHIAAKGLTRANIEIVLKRALDCGITNVFALQGDSTIVGDDHGGDFPYAIDLVNFIRNRFSNRFCICVAGYPEMHPQSSSKELDLFYLKAKVDAGAEFIITQIFFEANVFINFVKDCRKIGIDVPIIAGIFPIPNYSCLEKMSNLTNVKVPRKIQQILQPIKNNDEAISNYSIELVSNIIKDILESGTTHGFHFFTLNRTALTSKICDQIGLFS